MSAVLSNELHQWSNVKLGDVADLVRGVTYAKTDAREQPADGYIPVLRATNIQGARLILDSDLVYVPERNVSSEQRLRPGDIVVATSSGSKHLVGKSGQIRSAWQGSFGAFCAAIRPKSNVDSRYLAYFLRSPCYWRAIGKKALGVNINNLRRGDLETLTLPLPPIAVQLRIVAELDKQFSRLDEAITNLKCVRANLKRYRAAILRAAVEGRLVPTEAELARRQGRSYESGVQLFERILETRRSKWKGKEKYSEPRAMDTSNLPQSPDGWAWVPFALLGADPYNTVQTGPFGAQLHNTEFTPQGVPVIAVGNLTGTGFTLDGLYFISEAKAKQLARYDVWAGDLLFARSGATLGKVCVAPPEVKGWRMTGHILRARLDEGLMKPEIAVYSLAALPAVRRQVFGNVRGVTRPGFNTALLESILIPVPPLSEQLRIVAEVDRRLSFVRTIEAEVEAAIARTVQLQRSVLATPFGGDLGR